MRLLGIPTVIERVLQQAVGQTLAIKFEMEFEDYSYGFRPNRNAQQAVLKAQQTTVSFCNCYTER
jgi:RNA-directed DNA polymerase